MRILFIAAVLSTFTFAANAEKIESNTFQKPKITFEEAKQIALDAVKATVKVVEAELEMEEGQNFTYEVEVEAGNVVTEVEIDAETGNIMEIGADD